MTIIRFIILLPIYLIFQLILIMFSPLTILILLFGVPDLLTEEGNCGSEPPKNIKEWITFFITDKCISD